MNRVEVACYALDIYCRYNFRFCLATSLSSSRISNSARHKLAFSSTMTSFCMATFDGRSDISNVRTTYPPNTKESGVTSVGVFIVILQAHKALRSLSSQVILFLSIRWMPQPIHPWYYKEWFPFIWCLVYSLYNITLLNGWLLWSFKDTASICGFGWSIRQSPLWNCKLNWFRHV